MYFNLRQNANIFNIMFMALSFNYAVNVFALLKVFDSIFTAITCISKIKSKIYKYNLFLFTINY